MAQLSTESRRARWLILSAAWIVVAVFAILDAVTVRDYVSLLDNSGAASADSLPLARTIPADYSDAQTWVRYAIALEENGAWRLRHTDIDNAPYGRAVHWNSAFAQAIRLAGRLQRAATGEPFARATEQTLAWFNLPLFLGVVVLFSSLVARRVGAAGGVLVVVGMLGHRWFYFGFSPNYVDHHGVLAAAAFGVVLGATFMGAGWLLPSSTTSILPRSRTEARRGAILSAVSGGVGMWISAASTIPTIAIVGLAGVLAGWWLGPRAVEEGATLDASLWRLWSRIGAAASLAAYLLEYAPHDITMRLEVNHPLYILAWLGGGELVAMILEWRIARASAPLWRISLATLAVAAAPLTIALGGARVFVPLDWRITRLHAGIGEFFSLPVIARTFSGSSLWQFAIGFVLALPVFLVLQRRIKDRLLLCFLSVVVLFGVALACWQLRWWLSVSGAELCLLLVAIAAVTAQWRLRARWVLVLIVCALFAEQAGERILITRSRTSTATVTPADAMEPLFRDVAATIHASQSSGDVVLLTNPNASTGIGYFGRFKTVGTLYWENADGLAAAAAMFSARTDDDARTLLRARGVTHIAMLSKDDFLRAYLTFADSTAPREQIAQTFGYRLMSRHSIPRWLRPIPFRNRAGAAATALIFQVVPDQSDFDLHWNSGVAAAAMGDSTIAEAEFRAAIDGAESSRRASLYEEAAGQAYRWDAPALALRLYRLALALQPTPTIRANIAWILATSSDDRVRDGRAALEIIEPLAQQHQRDPILLDVYSAALAENGRFPDAIQVAEQMALVARASGDAATEARAAERIQAYRAAHAWRR